MVITSSCRSQGEMPASQRAATACPVGRQTRSKTKSLAPSQEKRDPQPDAAPLGGPLHGVEKTGCQGVPFDTASQQPADENYGQCSTSEAEYKVTQRLPEVSAGNENQKADSFAAQGRRTRSTRRVSQLSALTAVQDRDVRWAASEDSGRSAYNNVAGGRGREDISREMRHGKNDSFKVEPASDDNQNENEDFSRERQNVVERMVRRAPRQAIVKPELRSTISEVDNHSAAEAAFKLSDGICMNEKPAEGRNETSRLPSMSSTDTKEGMARECGSPGLSCVPAIEPAHEVGNIVHDTVPKRKKRRVAKKGDISSLPHQRITYRELDRRTIDEFKRAAQAEMCACQENGCEHKDSLSVSYLIREKIRVCRALKELKKACPLTFPDVSFKYHWKTVVEAKTRSEIELYSQSLDECGIKPFYSVGCEDECGIHSQQPSVINKLVHLLEVEFCHNCTAEERSTFLVWSRQVAQKRAEQLESIWSVCTENGGHSSFVEDLIGCRRSGGYVRPADIVGGALRSVEETAPKWSYLPSDSVHPRNDDASDTSLSDDEEDAEYRITFHRTPEPPQHYNNYNGEIKLQPTFNPYVQTSGVAGDDSHNSKQGEAAPPSQYWKDMMVLPNNTYSNTNSNAKDSFSNITTGQRCSGTDAGRQRLWPSNSQSFAPLDTQRNYSSTKPSDAHYLPFAMSPTVPVQIFPSMFEFGASNNPVPVAHANTLINNFNISGGFNGNGGTNNLITISPVFNT